MTAQTDSDAARLDTVSKFYPPPTRVRALIDVSLRLRKGETVAITGPSGSGKSTLLNLLGTLEPPTSGQVYLDGIETSGRNDAELSGIRSASVGFVFQQFHLLQHLSVLDNVATGLVYRGVRTADRRQAARAALERVGLGARMSHRPAQLSGGEQQRAAIARAIIGKPALILADEPSGNLDSVSSAMIMDLLVGMVDPHTSILVVTHDPRIAASMDRQVVLRDGSVVEDSGAEHEES